VRWVGVIALVATLVMSATASAAAGQAACPDQQLPPPPSVPVPVPAELAVPAPEPLPWPHDPVGGPQLGTCGDVGTAGAPVVGAASWVLADLDTGAVLAARAPHARHRPASALKVLTALVVLRRLAPDTVVEGTAEDLRIEGSKAGIGIGGRYSVRQLLAGLLLNSGNDTAHALARALGGDAATVAAMTALARELGALDTRPATPSGLDGPGMACSAYDLALLFRVATRDPLFAGTIATRSVPFPGYGAMPGFELSNSDRLLARYPGALGGKAGFTDAARHTLVGAAERGGRRLVVALMRGEQAPVPMWRQAAALLDWGFARPAGPAPVGVLVDAAPAPPPSDTRPAAAEAAAPRPAAPAPSAALPIGAIAIAAAALTLALRRRSRR
jgi:D-alanyl-D-alanine carboxypeptidase (penicillin-binding protein 5/6)